MEKGNLPSLWVEVELEKMDGPLRLKLSGPSFVEIAKMITEALDIEGEEKYIKFFDLITDWDLEKDGEQLPCNKENKEKYLRPLLDRRVTTPVHIVGLDIGTIEIPRWPKSQRDSKLIH